MTKLIPFVALLAAFTALAATAADRSPSPGSMAEHASMGKGDKMHGEAGAGAGGEGVVNTVDVAKNVVNISHGPIPELSWPEMTMDLPVAEGVDLGGVQSGDKVRFRVELGADQVYRITAIDAAP